jgi:hypothetical protein
MLSMYECSTRHQPSWLSGAAIAEIDSSSHIAVSHSFVRMFGDCEIAIQQVKGHDRKAFVVSDRQIRQQSTESVPIIAYCPIGSMKPLAL